MNQPPGAGAASREPTGYVERPDQRLSKSQRLTHKDQFADTFAQGRRGVGRYMVMWLRLAPDACLRLGVVSSRKVGGAVQRNLARRKLREAWRRNRHKLEGQFDVVLVARREIVTAKAPDVERELMQLAGRAGMVGNKHA